MYLSHLVECSADKPHEHQNDVVGPEKAQTFLGSLESKMAATVSRPHGEVEDERGWLTPSNGANSPVKWFCLFPTMTTPWRTSIVLEF